MVHKKLISNNIIWLHFDTQYELTSTFMRMQEFYESPYSSIRGKYFTLEQYMDAYAAHEGNFTYTKDWEGFNVPGKVVLKFFETFKYDLLKKEVKLYGCLKPFIKCSKGDFYVIGTYGSKYKSVLRHEVAHALFALNKKYKTSMLELIGQNDLDYIYQCLMDMGYGVNVVEDEAQAYLSTGLYKSMKVWDWNKVQDKFKKVFNEYYK